MRSFCGMIFLSNRDRDAQSIKAEETTLRQGYMIIERSSHSRMRNKVIKQLENLEPHGLFYCSTIIKTSNLHRF